VTSLKVLTPLLTLCAFSRPFLRSAPLWRCFRSLFGSLVAGYLTQVGSSHYLCLVAVGCSTSLFLNFNWSTRWYSLLYCVCWGPS